jgi:probable rRNA maturation factor
LSLEVELEGDGILDADGVRRVVAGVLEALGVAEADIAVGLQFVDEERIRELNLEHRGKDEVTDVLSFPIDPLDEWVPDGVQRQLGDVAICLPQVARQAAEAGVAGAVELTTMLIHGVLHLAGYDHETDEGSMLAIQDQLVAGLEPVRWEPE